MSSCSKLLKALRRYHRNVKSESIKHQIVVVLVQRSVIDVRQQSNYFELLASNKDGIPDLDADIARMHSVDGDLVLIFRSAAFVE